MGATILARRANLDWPILHVPAGVLAGLAVELYLKCLLLIQVGQFPATHNFKVLFGQLPRVTRIRLEKKHDEIKATHPDFAAARETSLDPNDLMSVLDAAQESFTELRYPYEQDIKAQKGSVFPLWLFLMCVRDRILELHPDWSDIPPTFPLH